MWQRVEFTNGEEAEYKKGRMEKDVVMSGKNIFDSDNTWLGDLAEEGVKRLFDEHKVKYIHWTNRLRKDLRDFTVGELEIDVKCMGVNFYPREDYAVDVAKVQTYNEVVNTYIFTHYVLPKKTLVIIGWKPKAEFLQDASEYMKDQYVRKKFYAPCDMYENLCNQTRTMESFLSLTKL